MIYNDRIGYELPQTGGIGTGIFTAAGILLVSAAGAALARRKRKEEQHTADET